ncbi:hypothetical protein B0T26DRAFT_675775 [Lasiosphaeria miniovina]|uniref:Uncharacterized protein n=1 Tax=Lasiosphaeria miniovina TaxID=1954250 RepID=A0AA40AKG9_9PEZI|nr:uncharacterized protein B0T26DRAFT_675775 [Lasiosphaeria miniovina]KAK0717475.1 hypothetical protein B0T26DRAFT_675775 [Lasiosphaeria miniovina]
MSNATITPDTLFRRAATTNPAESKKVNTATLNNASLLAVVKKTIAAAATAKVVRELDAEFEAKAPVAVRVAYQIEGTGWNASIHVDVMSASTAARAQTAFKDNFNTQQAIPHDMSDWKDLQLGQYSYQQGTVAAVCQNNIYFKIRGDRKTARQSSADATGPAAALNLHPLESNSNMAKLPTGTTSGNEVPVASLGVTPEQIFTIARDLCAHITAGLAESLAVIPNLEPEKAGDQLFLPLQRNPPPHISFPNLLANNFVLHMAEGPDFLAMPTVKETKITFSITTKKGEGELLVYTIHKATLAVFHKSIKVKVAAA